MKAYDPWWSSMRMNATKQSDVLFHWNWKWLQHVLLQLSNLIDSEVKPKCVRWVKKTPPWSPSAWTFARGGTDSPKWHFFMFYSKFLCYGQLWASSSKTLYSFRENLPSNRPNYFLDFPIIGPKNKVVINFIYGYQTLSGETCKSNGKRFSSIRHTSEEKNPKKHPKIPYFRKVVFSDGFLDFSLHWYVGLS